MTKAGRIAERAWREERDDVRVPPVHVTPVSHLARVTPKNLFIVHTHLYQAEVRQIVAPHKALQA
jgi:hypothetical protein